MKPSRIAPSNPTHKPFQNPKEAKKYCKPNLNPSNRNPPSPPQSESRPYHTQSKHFHGKSRAIPQQIRTSSSPTPAREHRLPLQDHPVEHGPTVHLALRGRCLSGGDRDNVPCREAVVRHRRAADRTPLALER